MSAHQPKSCRNTCFTLNNWTDDEFSTIMSWFDYSYIVVGREGAKSGTPHLQGYVEFNSSVLFSTIKRKLPRIHLEERRATPLQAADYCKKEGDFVEQGTISAQGKRTDIDEVMNAVRANMSTLGIYEMFPQASCKYFKFIDRYKLLVDQRDTKWYHKKDVRVYWGATGTGKTRSAMEEFPDAFIVSEGVSGFWWDGYDGEDVVVMDEFRGNIPLSHLLRILDGYQCQVSIKGGSRHLSARTIIITSNVDPQDWYQNCDHASREALNRRFTTIKKFDRQTI